MPAQQHHFWSCQIFSRKLYVGFSLSLSEEKRDRPKSSIWSPEKLFVLRRIKAKTHKIWSERFRRALSAPAGLRGFREKSLLLSFIFFLTWLCGLFQVLCWVRLFNASVNFKSSSDLSVWTACFCISQWEDGAGGSATCSIRTYGAH